MSRDLSSAEADVEAGGRGLAELNPNPVKAYHVTLRIENAPGTFKQVDGVAQYDVVNEEECGRIHPVSGTPSRITSQEPIELERISETEFRGTFYLDRMKDQDIFGRGVCRWEFTGAGALLKATGTHEETRFLTLADASDLVAGKPYTRYYPKRDYPRAGAIPGTNVKGMDDYPSSGDTDRNGYRPELQDALFTITVSATRAGA